MPPKQPKNLKITKEAVAPQATAKLNKVIIIAGLVLGASILALALYMFQPVWLFPVAEELNYETPTSSTMEALPEVAPCPDCVRHPLSGLLVPKEQTLERPWAVMIDNQEEARPSAGLNKASLVFEAPAEGGVTRYLAIFSTQDLAPEIGPIRSARPYFLNWAKQLGATYVHVGGSPEALVEAKKLGVQDLNEFYNGGYFWRDKNRFAPHNVMTSEERLLAYRSQLPSSEFLFTPYLFKDGVASTTASQAQIIVKYGEGYNTAWQYQAETNRYERYLNNHPHQEIDQEIIKTDNLIFHIAGFRVLDEKLRLEMVVGDSGPALLCQDGQCVWGTWRQANNQVRPKYYLKDGAEFIFNAGKTWISVVPKMESLQY